MPKAKTKPRSGRTLTQRRKALGVFQLWVRLRDADENGYAQCISCGRTYHYKQMDGGHYEGRMNRGTELEEDNCHAQCKRCNGPLQGNAIAYRNRLIEKIGIERVMRIEDMAMAYRGDEDAMEMLSEEDRGKVRMKRTDEYYREREVHYRKEADALAKEKGI